MIKSKGRGGQLDSDLIDPQAILNKDNYERFVNEILAAHNKYRELHNVPTLELKKEVGQYSQEWAEILAKNKILEHSKQENRPNYGENVYWSSAKYVPGNIPVDSWYSEAEKDNYQYGEEPLNLNAGHFTQVVWKNSKYLGIGAVSWERGMIVVCNYEPKGNIMNNFTVNVFPPLTAIDAV